MDIPSDYLASDPSEDERDVSEAKPKLPTTVGIRKPHRDLSDELIERVITVFRNPDRKLTSYSVRDEEYLQQAREMFHVTAGDVSVTIELVTKKG